MTSAPPPLARRLRPAGPVAHAIAAERLYETLRAAAQGDGWIDLLEAAWPALAPVAAAVVVAVLLVLGLIALWAIASRIRRGWAALQRWRTRGQTPTAA